MKPWMKRVDSSAIAAMRQSPRASVWAGACPAMRPKVVADMFISYVTKEGGSVGWRLAGVWPESVTLEDRQRRGRADEGKPELRRLLVWRSLHHRAGIHRLR